MMHYYYTDLFHKCNMNCYFNKNIFFSYATLNLKEGIVMNKIYLANKYIENNRIDDDLLSLFHLL